MNHARHRNIQLGISLCVAFIMLIACSPPPTIQSITPTPVPRTLWGDIITVGQASFAPAPELMVDRNGVTMAWTGEDEERVYQAFRRWHDGQLQQTVIPVLDSFFPFEQRMFPADNDGFHLLWMDRDPQSEVIKLFSAYIDQSITTIITPDSFANQQVTHYTAIEDADYGIWVVWSGGLLAEPSLYVTRIDGLGRPVFPEHLTLDGDYPFFAKTLDQQTVLFWISQVNQRVMRADFVNGEIQNIRAISHIPDIGNGDRLSDFSVAFDRTHQYLFWNIIRDDGRAETVYATIPLNNDEVATPQPLTITVDTSATIQTGFNSGTVYTTVSSGESRLSWARPLDEPSDVLPVVTQYGDELGVVYMQGGAIVGYQTLAQVGRLLRAPRITTDRDRHLYVTWSQPTAYGVADLNVTTTR